VTQQERNEYRTCIHAAKTVLGREWIHAEHHELMKTRTKERGVILPDKPPVRSGDMGSRSDIGPSPSPGDGMRHY